MNSSGVGLADVMLLRRSWRNGAIRENNSLARSVPGGSVDARRIRSRKYLLSGQVRFALHAAGKHRYDSFRQRQPYVINHLGHSRNCPSGMNGIRNGMPRRRMSREGHRAA